MTQFKEEKIAGSVADLIDMKLEAVFIPVTEVDRAKEFYGRLGWRLDADFQFDNGFRVVQFTPPGPGASIQFGAKVTRATPGSARGFYLVVSDIAAAREQLVAKGVNVSEIFHPGAPGAHFQPGDPAIASAVRRRITPATGLTPLSATRTVTAGCCRKSRRGCRGASTAQARILLRQTIS